MTTVTTLEARATTKSLVAGGFVPLKEVAKHAGKHPVTVKKLLDADSQTPTKLGRRCFYRLDQLDGVLSHRVYKALETADTEAEMAPEAKPEDAPSAE